MPPRRLYRTARIGTARRVHLLDKYDAAAAWGVGLCQTWAGGVRLAPGEIVTCGACRQADSNRQKLLLR